MSQTSGNNHHTRARVVVTGMGMISPIGLTVSATWDNFLKGCSGIGPITQFDASELPVRIAGEARDFNPGDYMSPKEARRMSRGSQLVTAALQMALEDASLTAPLPDGERAGVVLGTGAGGLEIADRELLILRSQGYNKVSPFAMVGFLPNMPAYHVSLMSGAKGPISTVVAACASGTQAVGDAVELIRGNKADLILAGGVEGLIHPSSVVGFARMGALSTRNDQPERAMRPFDLNRDGTVLSEGAAVLVLERLEHAWERGATIHAEILGQATSSDAFHIATPDPEAAGAVRAMRWALQDAGVLPDQVDYINAHGTSTPLNDSTETTAIKHVFGERAYELPVSSSKSALGHTLGASGAIEAILCVNALQHDLIPPTWNYETPDPACDLDYVPNVPRPAMLEVILSNSFGMGGQNACLVLSKYHS